MCLITKIMRSPARWSRSTRLPAPLDRRSRRGCSDHAITPDGNTVYVPEFRLGAVTPISTAANDATAGVRSAAGVLSIEMALP